MWHVCLIYRAFVFRFLNRVTKRFITKKFPRKKREISVITTRFFWTTFSPNKCESLLFSGKLICIAKNWIRRRRRKVRRQDNEYGWLLAVTGFLCKGGEESGVLSLNIVECACTCRFLCGQLIRLSARLLLHVLFLASGFDVSTELRNSKIQWPEYSCPKIIQLVHIGKSLIF